MSGSGYDTTKGNSKQKKNNPPEGCSLLMFYFLRVEVFFFFFLREVYCDCNRSFSAARAVMHKLVLDCDRRGSACFQILEKAKPLTQKKFI